MQKLPNIVLEWLEYIEQHKKFSNNTVESYRFDVINYLNFLESSENIGCDDAYALEEIMLGVGIRNLRAWIAHLVEKSYTTTSIARMLSAVKSLYRFLLKREYKINESIFILNYSRVKKKLPKTMSVDDVKTSLDILLGDENYPIWIRKRNYAIVLLLYATGMRISEALSLRVCDIPSYCVDTSVNIKITGKGDKERIVPVLSVAIQALQEYVKNIPYPLSHSDFMFINAKGKIMMRWEVNRILIKMRNENCLPNNTTPHAYRHSCASHLLSNKVDLKTIQELLGHESVKTTQIYTKVTPEHLKNVYDDLLTDD